MRLQGSQGAVRGTGGSGQMHLGLHSLHGAQQGSSAATQHARAGGGIEEGRTGGGVWGS